MVFKIDMTCVFRVLAVAFKDLLPVSGVIEYMLLLSTVGKSCMFCCKEAPLRGFVHPDIALRLQLGQLKETESSYID